MSIALPLIVAACASLEQSRSVERATPSARIDGIEYSLSPSLASNGKMLGLNVEMRFSMRPEGRIVINLPSEYAGESNLDANLSNISAEGGLLHVGDSLSSWQVHAPEGSRITFRYTVTSGIDHDPAVVDGQPFKPWIRDSWFYVYGATVFARPELPSTTPTTFEWTGPLDIPVSTDLSHFLTQGGQLGGQRGIFASATLGGKGVRRIESGAIRMGLHGAFAIPDSELLLIASSIIQHQRAFFGASQEDPYLVNVAEISGEPGTRGAMGGTGFGDAFAIAMTRDMSRAHLLSILAHETFHSWYLGHITNFDLWLHEGFTDYFATSTALRTGLMTFDEFAEVWNDRLIAYAASPARTRKGEELGRRWDDPDVEQMNYLRGAIIAAKWDRELRKQTNGSLSLDHVVLELYRQAKSDANAKSVDLLRAITSANGFDVATDIASFIDEGAPIVLSADSFGPCFLVERASIPTYDRGFDMEVSAAAGMIAKGVRRDGPAYAAGLREGMRLLELRDGKLNDSTKEAVWLVADGAASRVLRWRPEGSETLQIHRLINRAPAGASVQSCDLT